MIALKVYHLSSVVEDSIWWQTNGRLVKNSPDPAQQGATPKRKRRAGTTGCG